MNSIVILSVILCLKAAALDVVPEPELDLTGELAGTLAFYQTEGNQTYLRSNGELASDLPTEAVFELQDPQNHFRQASFTYTWDLRDGTPIQTSEPRIAMNFTLPGSYSLSVDVVAYWEHSSHGWAFPTQSNTFKADLTVLDAVRSIEVSGPSSILVDQSVALTLAVNGSPPMTVCWSITSDCQVASLKHCHVLKMNGKRCILNYTFPNSGHYCLGVKVKNDISAMQAFQDLTVQQDVTHLFLFILPCAALLLVTIGFIGFSAFRQPTPQMKSLLEVTDFHFSSPSSKNLSGDHPLEVTKMGPCCAGCSPHSATEGGTEGSPLLPSGSPSVRSYLA
ncbi:transmembrane protein 130 [Erpetoichthys calabaricus]|uniref:transmembrane protein 130 n=1 Tax=Erpetoichthys calabaricus TaxID=27687 RepID=UPI00109F4655|nr:transmembrane protein 130 [Erpetoichthys calabaricus]